jgi:hypothetical protein
VEVHIFILVFLTCYFRTENKKMIHMISTSTLDSTHEDVTSTVNVSNDNDPFERLN